MNISPSPLGAANPIRIAVDPGHNRAEGHPAAQLPLDSMRNVAATNLEPGSNKGPSTPEGQFGMLPSEMRQSILEKLDIKGLGAISQTSSSLLQQCIAVVNAMPEALKASHWIEAARNSDTHALALLIACGMDPDATCGESKTALYYAAECGNASSARLLLGVTRWDGTGVRTTDGAPGASRLLHYFARSDNADAVRTLTTAGANPNTTSSNTPALLAAIRKGNSTTVAALVEAGADVNVAHGDDGTRALSNAIQMHDNLAVECMLKHPAIFLRREDGISAIAEAQDWNDSDCGTPNILKQLKNLDQQRAHPGGRLWTKAAVEGDLAALTEMNERYGREVVDGHTTSGRSALTYAAIHGHVDVLKALISWGANPDIHDGDGRTPLHEAVVDNQIDVVRYLLTQPVELNQLDASGKSPLHQAVLRGNEEMAELLLHAGASPNMRPRNNGKTPLKHAAWHGMDRMVRLLLSFGADPLAVDESGQTPLDKARVSNSSATIAAFAAHLNS